MEVTQFAFLTLFGKKNEDGAQRLELRTNWHVAGMLNGIQGPISPFNTTQCIRVPVLNGHTAAVFVKFRNVSRR